MAPTRRSIAQPHAVNILLDLAGKGDVESLRPVIASSSVDVCWKTEEYSTALHKAAWNGRLEAASLLVQKGANINAQDIRGYTPLYLAVLRRHNRVVEFLAAEGADLNAQDIFGATALHAAAAVGNLEGVNILLEYGADCNQIDGAGCNPLFFALKYGQDECTQLLVQFGADPYRRTLANETPYIIASPEHKRWLHANAQVSRPSRQPTKAQKQYVPTGSDKSHPIRRFTSISMPRDTIMPSAPPTPVEGKPLTPTLGSKTASLSSMEPKSSPPTAVPQRVAFNPLKALFGK